MKRDEYENLFDTDTKVYKVFQVLKDGEWHCRLRDYGT